MLLPSKFKKLHQQLHIFRSNVLPLWLSERKTELIIPESCCDDYILWQCCIDKILERELSELKESNSISKPRVLNHVEQNAMRYAAGSVMQKLQKKWASDQVVQECLCGLLQLECDDCQDSAERWLEATDRGGLYYINDMAYELFVEVEILVYHHLSKGHQQHRDELLRIACLDADILSVWSTCTVDIDDTAKTELLLKNIIDEWITMRGHSIVSMITENHKKNKHDTNKKKGLRTELKRQDNED